MLYSFVEILMF